MPEQPPPKRRPVTASDSAAASAKVASADSPCPDRPRYAELHCRTNYSFLEGASHPDELVQQAARLGYEALAITDRNSLAGVVRAHVAARDTSLPLLIGAEVTPEDAPAVVLLATDRAAYGQLARLLTVGRRRAPKGECRLAFDDIATHQTGLLACVVLQELIRQPECDPSPLHHYRELFADRCYALAETHYDSRDQLLRHRRQRLSRETGIPLVAANDVHYHQPQRRYLQDVLTAIRHGCTVAELGHRMFHNSERCLKSPEQMHELFADCPGLAERTVEIAARCTFSLDELRYEYPEELGPSGVSPLEYLQQLTWSGARERYPDGIPERVQTLIRHELQLIEELHYEAYFLTVWDLVRFARSRHILCQGRGSAANSVVCFCLGVTSVDPEEIDVLFERFISRARDEAPDIDVDFEHERREEVLQYLYEKYGRERAGIAATVVTYRSRSAIQDVSKALGLSPDRAAGLSGIIGRHDASENLPQRLREAGLNPDAPVSRQLTTLVQQILGFPRHLSQHVGGMVMTRGPLCELVPIENAAMPGRTVVQWDKDDLDALGILKVDCLSLGMLTAIRKCFALISQHHQRDISLETVPGDEDPDSSRPVYDMIRQADTIGVFQIESRAQMSMLPRLRPECFYDLVVEVAIVRPGPIQGNMVHPYLQRRERFRDSGALPEYPNPEIEAVLRKTFGVPIFQEQAMRLAVVAGGFTLDEADQLRRAMGAWRRPGLIDSFRQKLIDGMTGNGYSNEFAERLFNQIRGFGEYGFPESHAASFARLTWVSSWLKCYYPAAFTVSLLNSQPMGFYAPSQLVADVRRHGVEVRPVDVSFSHWDCTLEPIANNSHNSQKDNSSHTESAPHTHAVRLGFRMISGLAIDHAETIMRSRATGRFHSFEDFVHRTGLTSSVLKRLSRADVFQSLHLRRRTAIWQSLPQQNSPELLQPADADEPAVNLPVMTPRDRVLADYKALGLSLQGHPFEFVRPLLDDVQPVAADQLATLLPDRRYAVAGLVVGRQRPATAKGTTFVTLEDETGSTNLIIWQDVWERYRHAAQTAGILIAWGQLQRQNEVIHIIVDRLEDVSEKMAMLESRSRDFR